MQYNILKQITKNDPNLIILDLYTNNIGVIGAQALAEALKTNSTITYLGLGNNNIGDSDGALQTIRQMIKRNLLRVRILESNKTQKTLENEYGRDEYDAGMDSGLYKVRQQHLGLSRFLLKEIVSRVLSNCETRLVCKTWRRTFDECQLQNQN